MAFYSDMAVDRRLRQNVFLFCTMFFLYGQALLFLDAIPILGMLFSVVRVGLFILLIALFLREFILLKYEVWMLLYASLLLLITVFRGGDILVFASHFMNVVALWVLFKLYFSREPVLFLRNSSVVLSLFAYANFFLTLLFPNGLISSKFLLGGNYNQMGAVLLLTMIVHVVHCQLKGKYDLNLFCLIVISLFTVLYVGSMTSSVCLVLFVFFLLIFKLRISRVLFSLFFIGVLLMNIGLLALQVSIESPYVIYFIENVLNKDLSFSGRVDIWAEAVDMISESFFYGYGMRSMEWYDFHFNALTPHNFILSVFLKGGIILFLLFTLLVCIPVYRTMIYKSNPMEIVKLGSCILLLMMTMETYPIFIVFFLMFMMYFASSVYYYGDSEINEYDD